jgi:UPF0755 protein
VKRVLIVLGVVGVVALAVAGGVLWKRKQDLSWFASTPFGSDVTKTVEIPPGTGPHALGALLARTEVVGSADDFYQLVRREQVAPKLKAGEYEFKGPLTPLQVLEKLIKGEVKTYHFTVPEGLRADEIFDILAKSELKLDHDKLMKIASNKAFLKKAGVPADNIEGFLYPDTYTFTHGADEEAVLSKMISRTLEEYRKADAHRNAGIDYDLLKTITAASIIEKETGAAGERPHISCVLRSRLRLKMKLMMDPTTLYAMMLIRGKYVNNLTLADLRTPHPYNTYTTAGLPPGPIANPGAAAIEAALNPLECRDLYYVSRNDGTSVFCPDLKCHNAAVDRWQKQFFKGKKR